MLKGVSASYSGYSGDKTSAMRHVDSAQSVCTSGLTTLNKSHARLLCNDKTPTHSLGPCTIASYCSLTFNSTVRQCDRCSLLLLIQDSHSNYAVRAFFTWHNNAERLTTDFVFNDIAIFLLAPNSQKRADQISVAFLVSQTHKISQPLWIFCIYFSQERSIKNKNKKPIRS